MSGENTGGGTEPLDLDELVNDHYRVLAAKTLARMESEEAGAEMFRNRLESVIHETNQEVQANNAQARLQQRRAREDGEAAAPSTAGGAENPP